MSRLLCVCFNHTALPQTHPIRPHPPPTSPTCSTPPLASLIPAITALPPLPPLSPPAQGGTHKTWPVATTGVMLLKGPQARRWKQKAVPTQGSLWPPQESCYLRGHMQGGTQTRLCTNKPEHTEGGLWPSQQSCYLRGNRPDGTPRRRCTLKALHREGGLWPPHESCHLRGHPQGGAQTRRTTQKAVYGHRGTHVIQGATGELVHTEGGAHSGRCTHKLVKATSARLASYYLPNIGKTLKSQSRRRGWPQAASPIHARPPKYSFSGEGGLLQPFLYGQGPKIPDSPARVASNSLSYLGKDAKSQYQRPNWPQKASLISAKPQNRLLAGETGLKRPLLKRPGPKITISPARLASNSFFFSGKPPKSPSRRRDWPETAFLM